MKNFNLLVATPTGKAFEGSVSQISLMGECGSLSVMADHIPFITAVKKGTCRVYLEDGIKAYETDDGILSVTRDCVRIITTTFKPSEIG